MIQFGILGFLFLDVSQSHSPTPCNKMLESTREPRNELERPSSPLELSGTSRKRVSPDATDDALAFAGYLGK
jgi:hypothetical protein